jgi:ABC-2 type transport system ATP-binding protein
MDESMSDVRAYVEVSGVFLSFRQVQVLKDISFCVPAGTVFGLVGSDGAGKSSMLRLIAGMLRAQAGEIHIGGLNSVAAHRKIKRLIGYMPQRFGLYPDLTIEENMDFFMDVFGIPRAQRAVRKEKYLGFSNLLPFMDRLAGNLSGGMKQKLGLACVLVHEPELLILDEPTNGVDPVSRREFWDMLGRMRGEGMTILVSSAYLDEAKKCDRLGLMHAGVLLEQNTPALMQGDYPSLEAAVVARIKKADRGLADDTFQY